MSDYSFEELNALAARNAAQAEVSMLRDAVRAQDQFIAEQNAALRELVAYCQDRAVPDPETNLDPSDAYADVGEHVQRILNNVTSVERPVDPRTGLDL